MKLLYNFYTYNRPKIFSKCIESILNNNKTKPDRITICDDGSDIGFRNNLYNLSLNLNETIPTSFYTANTNLGYGFNREVGDSFVDIFEPDFFTHIETDYYFRKGGIDEAILLLEKYFPNAIGVSLFSNPDEFDKSKTHGMYSEIMKQDYGEDNSPRETLHISHTIVTEEFGDIEYLLTTNTCGTFLINNLNLKKLMTRFPEMRENVFKRSCNKYKPQERRYYSDGTNTHGISYYFYKYHKELGTNLTIETNGPWISIIDTPISHHFSGGGLNSQGWAEGTTFLHAKGWPQNPDTFERVK